MQSVLEDRLHADYDTAISATLHSARVAAIERFAHIARTTLESRECGFASRRKVYEYCHYLLSRSEEAEVVWAWLKCWAGAIVDESGRIEIAIAIWAPWPEDPVSWLPLSNLFQWWFDPHVKWCVYSAYEECPDRLPVHFREFPNRPESDGKQFPSISTQEFGEWRAQC